MSNVLFTSDFHISHKNILKFSPDFETVEQRMEVIERNYLSKVTKRDKVFFLGDMLFAVDHLEWFDNLPGNKVLILGNHCTDNKTRPTIQQLSEVFSSIHGLYKYKDLWLSHCPLHPMELRGKKNVHGHLHAATVDDPRYLSVCLEQTDYAPIDLNAVRDRFHEQGVEVLHRSKPQEPKESSNLGRILTLRRKSND